MVKIGVHILNWIRLIAYRLNTARRHFVFLRFMTGLVTLPPLAVIRIMKALRFALLPFCKASSQYSQAEREEARYFVPFSVLYCGGVQHSTSTRVIEYLQILFSEFQSFQISPNLFIFYSIPNYGGMDCTLR